MRSKEIGKLRIRENFNRILVFGFLFFSRDDFKFLVAKYFVQLKKTDSLMRIQITNHIQFKLTHVKLFAQQ
jgi:hypothetical protein